MEQPVKAINNKYCNALLFLFGFSALFGVFLTILIFKIF